MSKKTTITTHDISEPWWGLRRSVSPCFGARLVQERNSLHYLADRANFDGQFCDADLRYLDQAFPVLMKLYAKGLTCEADTLGSHGYVYIAIYPTPVTTA